jgi:hypothetical protein
MNEQGTKRGFVLIFSILIVSLLLAMSLGTFAIALKEVSLATLNKESLKAFAAANRGIECALYWDTGFPQNGQQKTIFATSSGSDGYPGVPGNSPGVLCDGQNITTGWAAGTTGGSNPLLGANDAASSFTVIFPDATKAEVLVTKSRNLGTFGDRTLVLSNGYNTTNDANPRQTLRSLQVTWDIVP